MWHYPNHFIRLFCDPNPFTIELTQIYIGFQRKIKKKIETDGGEALVNPQPRFRPG